MSEPVGHGPRKPPDAMPKIRSNAHPQPGEKKEPEAPKEEVEPVQKVISGKAITRKPPWYKRMARSMIAEDAGNIGDYILIEVIVPTVKNLIRDTIIGSTERTLYGSSRRVTRGGGRESGSSFRTRYDQMAEGGEPRKMMSREARRRHDFSDVILSSREEAILVVEEMMSRVSRFGEASVSDLYDMLGETSSWADRSHGWTDLRDADVRQYRSGWLLDFPAPIPLHRR